MDMSVSPTHGPLSATPEALPPQDIGWDDLKLMIDGENTRPVAWNALNLLFIADPVSPTVHAKHLPPITDVSRRLDTNSRGRFSPIRFTLPSPTLILEAPFAYGPATILTTSPQSNYIYAYFPASQSRSSAGGLACVWEAKDSVNTWDVVNFWRFPAQAGVVAMRWLGEEREWYTQPGLPFRASRHPPLGPKLHMNHPAFLAVTEDHDVHVYYRVHALSNISQPLQFNSLSASLLSPASQFHGQSEHIPTEDVSPGGKRICSKAAIGLGYNDWSIMIATRSTFVPDQFPEQDLSVPSVMSDLLPESNIPPTSWLQSGMWGQGDMIELCEVELDLLSGDPCIVTAPLRPISTAQGSDQYLNHLFVTSHPLELPPSTDRTEISCSFQVFASFVGQADVHRFRSRLVSWRLSKALVPRPASRSSSSSPSRSRPASTPPSTDWSCIQSAERILDNATISTAQIWDATGHILLCKLNMSPTPSADHAGCLLIGESSIVSSVTLENNPLFESEPILRRLNKPSREVPLFVAISPHKTLLCTTSGKSSNPAPTVSPAPRWRAAGNRNGLMYTISSAIATRLRLASGSDMSDVIRAFWEIVPAASPTEAIAMIQTVCREVLILLDSPVEFDVNQPWLADFLGILMVIHRWAPFRDLQSRWKTAYEICQLNACVRAFDDSRSVGEGGASYDYTQLGVWELIQQGGWLIKRCESFLRMMIEWEHRQFSDELPSDFLMAVHPFPLELFLRALVHLNRLKTTVADLRKTENNQMATFALNSLVEDAGLDLALFQKALYNAKDLVRTSDIPNLKEHCRQSLFALKTSEALFPLLRRIADEYTKPQSQVIYRIRLFIPPDDVLATQTGSSTGLGRSNQEIDIIRKTKIPGSDNLGLGTKTCMRCGAKASIAGSQNKGHGWRVFENIWRKHCVCGGVWTQDPTGDLSSVSS